MLAIFNRPSGYGMIPNQALMDKETPHFVNAGALAAQRKAGR